MINVVSFNEAMLDPAGDIALELWGDETPQIPFPLRRLIYAYLPRYYFVPESPFSFAAVENGSLLGLLLAAPPGMPFYNADAWIAPKLQKQDRSIFREYQNYLNGNRVKEQQYAGHNDLILYLFASIRTGCGRLLMQSLENTASRHQCHDMLLWTDETCNYNYYRRHDFTEVAKLPTSPSLPGLDLHTYIFRKKLSQ